MKHQLISEINETQLESVSGGVPGNPFGGGIILTIGIFTPKFNVSVVYINNAIINDPLTITVARGVHRLQKKTAEAPFAMSYPYRMSTIDTSCQYVDITKQYILKSLKSEILKNQILLISK